MRKVLLAGVVTSIAGIAMPAFADPFTGYAVGSWGNVQASGSGNVDSIDNSDAGGVASYSFGVGNGTGPNLFTFNGVGSDGGIGFSSNAEQAFNIGHFTYFNGETTNYPPMSSVDLGIALTLTSPISNSSNFVYNFGIDLTPNLTGDPVLDGDIVTIANAMTTTTFTVGQTVYTLALDGFSTDGGQTFTSQFLSPENSTAEADIYATITTNILPVPEPASLPLLAIGLAGLAMFAARKSSRV